MPHRRTILIALFLVALLALTAIGALSLRDQNPAVEPPTVSSSAIDPATLMAADDPLTLTFICEDSSHFSATFTASNMLEIRSAGVLSRTAAQEPDSRLRYLATDGTRYAFAGERVTVSTAAGDTVCSQPFDPENAPYNFGDPE